MYSVCYVLTGNEGVYFNEFMISVSSLRYYGYEGEVFLVTDSETFGLLQARKDETARFGVEIIPVGVPKSYSAKQASRYLKTSLREHVGGGFSLHRYGYRYCAKASR